MQKIGISELHQMILEEIYVNERNKRQQKKRLKNNPDAARQDANAKIQGNINRIKKILQYLKNADGNDPVVKDVASVLNNVESINESTEEPETTIGKQVKDLLEPLLDNPETRELTVDQVKELYDEFIGQYSEEKPKVELKTDGTEQDFLESIAQGLANEQATYVVAQRLNKNMSASDFIRVIIQAVENKLNIKQDDFIVAYKTVYANELVNKLDDEGSPEEFIEVIVKAVEDFGLKLRLGKPSVAGRKLLDKGISELGNRESRQLFKLLFPKALFRGQDISRLANKFIQLRNIKSSSERLDTTALARSSDQFAKRLKRFEDLSSVKDMDSLENLKTRIEEFSKLIKTYILGDFKGNQFKTEIMETLGSNDFWSLNKKGKEVPDDFFIEFDESLRNIARLEAFEDEDIKKVSASIENLGLELGPDKTIIRNEVDKIVSSFVPATMKVMHDRGVEKIRTNMENLVADQNLSGYSKRKAQESAERLIARFKERFKKKYGYSAEDAEGVDEPTEPTETEDKPISDAEVENEQEKKIADDANRYSQKQYEEWVDKNASAIIEDQEKATDSIVNMLTFLIEELGLPSDEEDDGGIDPDQLNEDDISEISDVSDSLEQMKKLGPYEYFTLRVMRSTINAKLYRSISVSDRVEFEDIKADYRKAVKPIVKRALSMEIMDIESEMEEQMISEQAGLIRKLAFNAKKFLGIEPGDFKSFYVHKYLEEELIDLQDGIARLMGDQGYQISPKADKERSEIPPHPEVKIRKTLKEFGEFLMALDSMTLSQAKEKIDSLESGEEMKESPDDERALARAEKALGLSMGVAGGLSAGVLGAKGALIAPGLLALYGINKFLFKKQKFSFARFLKALGKGKSRSKLYSKVLTQMKLNPKEQANIAWYFSKKGNVKKFAEKYLKEHSEYEEIIKQDQSRISNAISTISNIITSKFKGSESDEEGDTEDTTDTPSTDGSDPIEEALKPIIRKAMKEILEK